MIRRLFLLVGGLFLVGMMMMASGCGPAISGPRFWWDDQKRARLEDNYELPPVPAKVTDDREAIGKEAAPANPAVDQSSAGAVPKG